MYNIKGSPLPLLIRTFDGFDSPFHPSVIYVPDGWNGWRYWMVETPFSPKCKPYIDRNECPSIHVSNDGINWTEPKGLLNPIVNLNNDQIANLDYFSDPHLVLKPDGQLECWFRLTKRYGDVNHRADVTLLKTYSYNGVNWSSPLCIKAVAGEEVYCGKALVSPALIFEDGYRMWVVDSESYTSPTRGIKLYQSLDGQIWQKPKQCSFSEKINPWHIDVQKIKNDLWMVIYDYNDLTLWHSTDGEKWNFMKRILKPSHKIGSFFSDGLYRSCLTQNHNEGVNLYFSCRDISSTKIGLMSGPDPCHLEFIDNANISKTLSLILNQLFLKIKFMLTHALR